MLQSKLIVKVVLVVVVVVVVVVAAEIVVMVRAAREGVEVAVQECVSVLARGLAYIFKLDAGTAA